MKSLPRKKRTNNKKMCEVVVVVTRPLPRDGGMAEDHVAPEAGKLPTSCTRGRRGTESRQRLSAAKSP